MAGRTAITQCQANSPLKLLTPKSPAGNAWIFTSTYGGGLVGGDETELRLRAGANTRCLLTTQASTKIYRSDNRICRQHLNATVGPDAILVSLPDPIACFAGASFEQRQRFELAASASLVMLDWFTSGRKARGERWAFDRYRSSSEISVEGKCVFRDVLLLDPADGPLAGAMRMGRVDCYATVVVIGPAFERMRVELLKSVAEQPSFAQSSIVFAASPISGGMVIRAAAAEIEELRGWLKKTLDGVEPVTGQHPFH